jgi:hypothetical protein
MSTSSSWPEWERTEQGAADEWEDGAVLVGVEIHDLALAHSVDQRTQQPVEHLFVHTLCVQQPIKEEKMRETAQHCKV